MLSIYQKAAEISHSAIIITDSDATIIYVNDAFCNLTGYSKKEIIGQKPSILKSGVQPQECYKELWNTLVSGEEWSGEFCNKAKDGSIFWEFATIAPARDSNGDLYYVGVKTDITKIKGLEEKLVKLCDKADQVADVAAGTAVGAAETAKGAIDSTNPKP